MKPMSVLLAAALLLFASVVCVFADIARPKPSTSPQKEGKIVFHTGLTIVADPNAYEARLQITEQALKDLRDATAAAQPNQSLWQRVTHSPTRTIMTGLFLCLSLSFAGVWLARTEQRRGRKIVAAFVIGLAMLGAATVITRANAGPPSYYSWRGLPKALADGRATSGGLDIEIVPEGDNMKLIVPLRKKTNGDEE
jgi:hypothetical protein